MKSMLSICTVKNVLYQISYSQMHRWGCIHSLSNVQYINSILQGVSVLASYLKDSFQISKQPEDVSPNTLSMGSTQRGNMEMLFMVNVVLFTWSSEPSVSPLILSSKYQHTGVLFLWLPEIKYWALNEITWLITLAKCYYTLLLRKWSTLLVIILGVDKYPG